MVNVKKIGAIATGALFIGATFGMASAVTVPSGIASKLASGGVAKAQLVVGADAPGITADTESAKEIQDAVKLKLAATVGGDISIEFGASALHDVEGKVTYSMETLGMTYDDSSVAFIGNDSNLNLTLKFDGNADGDLKDDPDDYVLYDRIVIIDQSAGDIQFAKELTEHGTYATGDGSINAGEVIEIKGSKYVITDADLTDNNIELGPSAFAKTLDDTDVDKDNALRVSGEKKILYGDDGYLYFYSEGAIADKVSLGGMSSYPHKMTSSQVSSDEFKPYNIYVIESSSASAMVTMVEKSQLTKISNDEEGVMGYSSIKIKDTEWFTGGRDDIFLLGDPVSLVRGDTIDLADTYYQMKYTASKQFDILRKKVSTVASGTKLKKSIAPGKDFLKADTSIVMTTTGGTAQEEGPDLSIVNETSADDSKNLVLIGGPVANTLTSDLVENGKSTVDWYTSDGDIEVISSAFVPGKYGIIVAGKDRDATKAAAVAVAGDL